MARWVQEPIFLLGVGVMPFEPEQKAQTHRASRCFNPFRKLPFSAPLGEDPNCAFRLCNFEQKNQKSTSATSKLLHLA